MTSLLSDGWSQIDKVYVLGHMKYEGHRVRRVLKQLSERQVPEEKIMICAPTWGKELTAKQCFEVYDPWLNRNYPCFVFKSRALTKGEISLVMNFHAAITDAIKNGYSQIMVLESDVMLRHDFNERLASIMSIVNGKPWDYISLSDGVGTHTKGIQFGEWYSSQKVEPAGSPFPFRCTDSMLFHRNFFEKIHKTLIPFRDCLDWELNYQHHLHRAVVLWAEPHIIEQGSIKRVDPSILHTD
jgi:GR25 family glycosyltransferase involved in LPS biosynthesis